MTYTLYAIECHITSGIYIGKTKRLWLRWKSHQWMLRGNRHHCSHLQNAWNKYGEESFSIRIIDTYPTDEDLTQAEIDTIAYYRTIGQAVYNHTDGGDGSAGYAFTDEARKRLSDTQRQYMAENPEARTRISKRWERPGERKRQSEALRDVYAQKEAKQHKIEGSQRRWNNPEEIRKQSTRMRSMWSNDNIRENQREGLLRSWRDRSQNYTYILISPDGAVYEVHNLAAFATEHGLDRPSLHNVISGKRKHHRGWTGYRED